MRSGVEQVKLHDIMMMTDEHLYRFTGMCDGEQFFYIERFSSDRFSYWLALNPQSSG